MIPKISVNKCIKCFECIDNFTCPVDAIRLSKKTGKPYINSRICVGCEDCTHGVCPVGAIRVRRR